MLSLQGTSPVATVSMARPSRPQRVVLVLLACVPCVRSLVLPSVVPKLHEVEHGVPRAEAAAPATLTPAARHPRAARVIFRATLHIDGGRASERLLDADAATSE